MTAQHGRQIWDERKLKRLAAARADGLTMAQLAARFSCSRVTVERKLAELRARDAQGYIQLKLEAHR
jgi:chromosome segregation and condensation protein ScpB